MEPLLGEIKMFAGTFAPNGWYFCDGNLLSISQNSALFAIIGTTYGGDGVRTFQVPDLRGRTPIHSGSGQGINVSRYELGQVGGREDVTISPQQMPAHTHTIKTVAAADQPLPDGNYLSGTVDSDTGKPYNSYGSATPDSQLNVASVLPTGGSQPLNIQTPYLGINYIIAWTGIFPSRP